MIARHSAEESRGGGDGVEVVINESCHDDTRGDGQYTEKRIYLSSRMPSWTQSMIPRIFYITEKAWNYYPFTKTGERDTMKGSKSKSLMPHMVLTGIQ